VPVSEAKETSSQLKRLAWFILVAVVLIAVDQTSKNLIIANLQPNQSYDFLGSVVRFYLTFNNSGAFSMGYGQTWFFTLISSVAVLVMLWLGPRAKTIGWSALAGLALGGVTGNLIDRLVRAPGFPSGQVVDFIQIPFNYPIFNLADSAIFVSAVVVIIAIARGRKLGG